MKNILLLLLLSCGFMQAQVRTTATVISISGRVKYAAEAGAKFEKLTTGTVLSTSGQLQLKEGARIGILYDVEYAYLSKPGTYGVQSVIDDDQLFQRDDFLTWFADLVEDAQYPYFREVVLKGANFVAVAPERAIVAGFSGTPPPPKPGSDGHGDHRYNIIRLRPVGGKVGDQEVNFKWKLRKTDRSVKHFTFTLRDADKQVLLEKAVNGYSYSLHPADYRLEPGNTYSWQVSGPGEEEMSSPSIRFDFVAGAPQQQVLQALRSKELYQKADPDLRLLLEAAALERADFTSKADETYKQAASDKKNILAQLLQRRFWYEHDMAE